MNNNDKFRFVTITVILAILLIILALKVQAKTDNSKLNKTTTNYDIEFDLNQNTINYDTKSNIEQDTIDSDTKSDLDQNAIEYSYELYEMWTHETGNSQKMTYMDYRAITDKNSKQYELQQDPHVCINKNGFLMYRSNWYVVAMGTYWGDVGDKFIVYLDNSESIPIIIGDIKSNEHTDKLNYAHTDGHVLEFLIDSTSAPMKKAKITKYGLINKVFDEWDSKIVAVLKMEES